MDVAEPNEGTLASILMFQHTTGVLFKHSSADLRGYVFLACLFWNFSIRGLFVKYSAKNNFNDIIRYRKIMPWVSSKCSPLHAYTRIRGDLSITESYREVFLWYCQYTTRCALHDLQHGVTSPHFQHLFNFQEKSVGSLSHQGGGIWRRKTYKISKKRAGAML